MKLCFRANGEPDLNTISEWLSVKLSLDTRKPSYEVWVVPWIADVAISLGTLQLDGSVEGWITYLQSLGFEDVVQVSCLEFFGPRADRDK
ncbi:MAG TPA: hypothetical protein V6D12_24630 [Candidatus Obscuribacterales bacterium]